MALLTLDHVTFRYSEHSDPVITDFSLSVEPGQKIAIKADSGKGKTTLLRLLLGFERPNSGKILFNGNPISEDHFLAIRKSVAWLPQDLNIGNGTVKETIDRIFEFDFNQTIKPTEEQIMENLVALGLPADLPDSRFRELSTGQRQRVGLVLCHLLDRPLLLLDEPTSALDRASKDKALKLLFSQPDRTIVSTTHDLFWLERCDDIIELN